MGLNLLELLGLETLSEKIAADLAVHVNAHTTREVDRLMASLQEALDAHANAVSTQLQQVRDAVTAAQAAGDNQEELQARLDEALAAIDSATSRVEGLTSDLASDDPQGPAEEAGGAAEGGATEPGMEEGGEGATDQPIEGGEVAPDVPEEGGETEMPGTEPGNEVPVEGGEVGESGDASSR